MRENNVGRQSDRSYLCLVAIYVIHAILLNVVFIQPKLKNNIILPSSYVLSESGGLTNFLINSNKSFIMEIKSENLINERLTNENRRNNSSGYLKRRENFVEENDDNVYSAKSSTNAFLQQSKSGGTAVRAKTSGVSQLMNNAVNTATAIVERLSPAALGIISGCLVFLLTFTENDYV